MINRQIKAVVNNHKLMRSVVLKDVPPKTTVAGVPARVIGEAGCSAPSRVMDQLLAGIELGGAEQQAEKKGRL